jgi:hypothetical protein
MVQKKDGSWRMCVDYRKLNEKTIKDAFSIILSKVLAALQSPNGMVVNWYKPPFGVANAVFSFVLIHHWHLVVSHIEIQRCKPSSSL